MLYGMAWWTCMVYSMAWQALHGKHHMVFGYGLPGKAWGLAQYMVRPDGHDMVYGMAWRARNGVWYGLVGSA